MKNSIKILNTNSYKIGLDEIEGLKQAMLEVMKPIQSALKDKMYWSDLNLNFTEYKSRDGFIANTSNKGGVEINEIIPYFESYNFDFIEFGKQETEEDGQDGELDANLRIWFKFEGYDEETGNLHFYLYMGGSNNDAPYFRTKYEPTLFEAEFKAKSIFGIKKASRKHVNKLLKIIG